MKTILVPVDFSTTTARVGEAARTLAQLIGGRLVFLHVVQPPPVMMNEYYAFDPAQLAAAVVAGEKYADRKLAELGRQYPNAEPQAQTTRATGEPVPTILAQAEAAQADYIVMGSHGHGAFYDLIVGSTTQGVLKKAHCPVLIIPSPPSKSGKK